MRYMAAPNSNSKEFARKHLVTQLHSSNRVPDHHKALPQQKRSPKNPLYGNLYTCKRLFKTASIKPFETPQEIHEAALVSAPEWVEGGVRVSNIYPYNSVYSSEQTRSRILGACTTALLQPYLVATNSTQ